VWANYGQRNFNTACGNGEILLITITKRLKYQGKIFPFDKRDFSLPENRGSTVL
jgi:hypothetical protein